MSARWRRSEEPPQLHGYAPPPPESITPAPGERGVRRHGTPRVQPGRKDDRQDRVPAEQQPALPRRPMRGAGSPGARPCLAFHFQAENEEDTVSRPR